MAEEEEEAAAKEELTVANAVMRGGAGGAGVGGVGGGDGVGAMPESHEVSIGSLFRCCAPHWSLKWNSKTLLDALHKVGY